MPSTIPTARSRLGWIAPLAVLLVAAVSWLGLRSSAVSRSASGNAAGSGVLRLGR